MKPADTLYKLIKSLTKGEKIYFKKFSKRHVLGSGNKYVKLFDFDDINFLASGIKGGTKLPFIYS